MSTRSGPAAWRRPLRAHAKGLLGPEAAVELLAGQALPCANWAWAACPECDEPHRRYGTVRPGGDAEGLTCRNGSAPARDCASLTTSPTPPRVVF